MWDTDSSADPEEDRNALEMASDTYSETEDVESDSEDSDPRPLGHNFSKAEKYELAKQMSEPWHKKYVKISKKKPRKKYMKITTGKGDNFTDYEIDYLEYIQRLVPQYLFRVYSLGGVHSSSGLTTPQVYLPNSYRQKIKVFGDLANMTTKDCSLMLTAHTCWLNRREDEFMSWTSSLLFLLAHAILRHEKGQRDIYIAFGNTRELRTLGGENAPFYPTNALRAILPYVDVSELTTLTVRKTHDRHSTHEYLSAGEMRDPEGAVIHALFEDLVSNGLLELVPELIVHHLFLQRTGLYQHFVWLKRELFLEAEPKEISEEELKTCDRLASLLKRRYEVEAPFWAFVRLVACRLRPDDNPKFRDWVRDHYDSSDIEAGLYAGMHIVADNLPDVTQSLRLAREAAEALFMEPNPVPEVELKRAGRMHAYGGEDRLFPARSFYTYLDFVSELLMKRDIYGESPSDVQARRRWADCEGDMAELLKLSRITLEKDDDPAELGTVPSLEDIEWMKKSEAKYIADSVGRVVLNPRHIPGKNGVKKNKISNRQNRTDLRLKTGQPSPKEVRAKKAAQTRAKRRAEAKARAKCRADSMMPAERNTTKSAQGDGKDTAKETDREAKEECAKQDSKEDAQNELRADTKLIGKAAKQENEGKRDHAESAVAECEYRSVNKSPVSKKRAAIMLPEMPCKRSKRREQTEDERRSDFLARLELLSGRLVRRSTSRRKLAALHREWMEEVRFEVLYGTTHKIIKIDTERIGVDGMDMGSKSLIRAGNRQAALIL